MKKQSDYAWINSNPVSFFDASDDLYKKVQDGLFHVGQSYENDAAKTLYCAKCKGRQFNVGSGSYLTVIRCINCEWEEAIHSG